jgi:hypothetical protein
MFISVVRFEVCTAVTMKEAVFLDVTLSGSCKSRRFGRTYLLHHQGEIIGELGIALVLTSNQITLLRYVGS